MCYFDPAVNLRVTESCDQPHTGGAREANVQVKNDDDPYTLEVNDEEYDTILTSGSSAVMANRPPAPAPRPESLPSKEENVSFIAQGTNITIINKTYILLHSYIEGSFHRDSDFIKKQTY